MNAEIVFTVERAPEGSLVVGAEGQAIFVEVENEADLHDQVRDAVSCHFDEGQVPKVIRLHFVRDKVIAA